MTDDLDTFHASRAETMAQRPHPAEPGEADHPALGDLATSRHEAFQILVAALEALFERRKLTAGAGVKSEMARLTASGFDETSLGYQNFSEFLSDAQAHGIVDLYPRGTFPDVVDVVIALPGVRPEARPASSLKRRIRPDLWWAFVDWKTDWTRLWDIQERRSISFPTDPRPLEKAEYGEFRRNSTTDPDRFRQITPITRQDQLEWMRELVARLPDDEGARPVLGEALRSANPTAAFANAIRAFPLVNAKWTDLRYQRVLTVIHEWLAANDLSIDPHEPSAGDSSVAIGDRTRRGQRASPSRIDEDDTRNRIIRAVSRMPLSELLRLPIPAEYMLDI